MKTVFLTSFLFISILGFSQTREDALRLIKQNEEEAKKLVDQQLEAYNARDIEKFLEPYSDSVAVYTFPRKLKYIGKEKMREIYSGMFENITDLHAEVTNRIIYGSTVVDAEHVTGNNGMDIEALAIYTIKNGKIIEVHFVRQL